MEGSIFSLFAYVPMIILVLTACIALVIVRLLKELTHDEQTSTFASNALLFIAIILAYVVFIGTLFLWWHGWLG